MTRYKETRRRHPLAPHGSVVDGIRAEQELLAPVRERADIVIDTSGLSAAALRRKVADELLEPATPGRLAVTFTSFGHKHGPPRDADLAFDVRFLPNPHYDADLRPLTGFDQRIVDYVGRDGRLEVFYAPPDAAAGVPAAAVRRRGQGAPDGGDRLHRRAPPLRGHHRAPGGALPRPRRSTSSRSRTATSTGCRAELCSTTSGSRCRPRALGASTTRSSSRSAITRLHATAAAIGWGRDDAALLAPPAARTSPSAAATVAATRRPSVARRAPAGAAPRRAARLARYGRAHRLRTTVPPPARPTTAASDAAIRACRPSR